MSSSYGNSTRGRGRGQHRFVPKGGGSSSSSSSSSTISAPSPSSRDTAFPPRPRLTTPLRSPSLPASQVHDDKSQPHLITFVNYLPQDEALASGLGVENGGLDALESQIVVDILNDELSCFLRLKPREFWKQVASNSTLLESLDSYLMFRNRWYDFPHRGAKGAVAGVIVGEGELSRRVFMTFYRMSSNRDPGVSAHDCLSAKEHTALMQEKKLLDLPKLLDICGIYGHDNEDLTRSLVNNAMKAQPRLAETLPYICHQFLNITYTMHQRCSSSFEVLTSNGALGGQGHDHFHGELLEVMDFINDAILTLDAFVDAYKLAAFYFSCPVDTSNGDQDLLKTLGNLHDSLLPILQQGFILLSSDKDQLSSNLSLNILSSRILKFGWKVLELCYLSNEVHDDDLFKTCTKMFPFQVYDPVIRGDILMQTFRDINSHSTNSLEQSQRYGTFFQNIEKNYYILSRIDSLRSNGWIVLDDEQFHWLTQIAMPSSNMRTSGPEIPVSSASNKKSRDEDDVFMESKISQIKDIFPDYGKGFLSACLDVYNHNPEEVIQRILEGTLHEDLLLLDTSLEQIPSPEAASHEIDAKGKGVLLEPRDVIRKGKGKGVLLDAPFEVVGPSSVDRGGGAIKGDGSFPSSHGRYIRKTKDEVPDSEVLDSKAAKDSVRSTVLAAGEYEDEYDDSFDDLGLSVVESGTGEADIMGDDTGSSASEIQNSGPRWASQRKPQFYVKDGKNYSYKVSGSVAVSNAREAAVINLAQKDMIHGLGRGGNLPVGAAKLLLSLEEDAPDAFNALDSGSTGNLNTRGRGAKRGNYHGRGHGGNIPVSTKELADSEGKEQDSINNGGRGNSNFRGRGRGGRRGGNHHFKNLAMKKHFAGLSGS